MGPPETGTVVLMVFGFALTSVAILFSDKIEHDPQSTTGCLIGAIGLISYLVFLGTGGCLAGIAPAPIPPFIIAFMGFVIFKTFYSGRSGGGDHSEGPGTTNL